jgi:hypothetical protein
MNLISALLMFLLLMEGMAQNGGQPPTIPYLSILTADDSTVAVFSNQTMQYSALSMAGDISKIDCDTREVDSSVDGEGDALFSNSEVMFTWKLNGKLVTPDNEFIQNENGSLVFIEPVYGFIECFATNEYGVSYSGVQIIESVPKALPNFIFVHGPNHLAVPLNSTVKFNCESNSSDTEIVWTFNSEPYTNSLWSIASDEQVNKQTLTIENVNSDSVGAIGCFLKSGEEVQL